MAGIVDPERLYATAEKLFGRKLARLLGQITIISLVLTAVGVGGTAFLGLFIGDLVIPFLQRTFGAASGGVTLDNIETIITVLVAAIVFFVLVFALFVWVAMRTLRRRVVPISVIDDLAEFRSEGIKILNDLPPNPGSMQPQQITVFVQAWEVRWKDWADKVNAFLGEHFTKAEQLSFRRLGIIRQSRMAMALNPQHGHFLLLLQKQLTILEDMIQRHLERH